MFTVTITNLSSVASDDDVAAATAAIDRQVREEFRDVWSALAQVRFAVSATRREDDPASFGTDGVVFLCDLPVPDAPDGDLGFHTRTSRDVAYGYAFTTLSQALGRPWSTVLSHEVLEMIADPYVVANIMGPDPQDPSLPALYYKEICDPVQGNSYPDPTGILLSDFVTPRYFHVGSPAAQTVYRGNSIAPFGYAPGGYVEYVDASHRKKRRGDPAGLMAFDLKHDIDLRFPGLRRGSRHALERYLESVNKRGVKPKRLAPKRKARP